MKVADNILRDGFKIKTDKHREFAETLSDSGYCSIVSDRYFVCPHCDGEIPAEEFEGIDTQCPKCERTIQRSQTNSKEKEIVKIDEKQVYTTLRRKFKEITGLKHGIKEKLNYREHEVEYRCKLSSKSGDLKHQVQVFFEPQPAELIECMRIYNYSILTILVGGAVRDRQTFDQYDLPYVTLGGVTEATDSELQHQLDSVGEERVRHIDKRAEIADRWLTSRRHLEAMNWYEFEHTVQALLDKLFIQSRLLGGTDTGEEVPDGVMGFTVNGRNHRFLWDAKYIKFDGSESSSRSPHVPIADDEKHSISSEYRKMADHAHQYMSDQNVNLDGFILISPRIPESQLETLQRKLTEFEHSRDWNGKTVYFTLDALVDLYRRYDRDKSGVSKKMGFLMKAITDRLTQSDLHTDSEEIEKAENVIKFGVDDVEAIFNELSSIPEEHEMPSYEVYVSRRRQI